MKKNIILMLFALLFVCIFSSCTMPKEYIITEKYYEYTYHKVHETEEYKEEYVFYFKLKNEDEKLTIEVSVRDYIMYHIGDKYKYKK